MVAEDGYRIIRPHLANDVAAVRQWLRDHRDGGWTSGDDLDRMRTAKRLLFVLYLVKLGRISDG